jgi:GDP-L-fucose synthase
MNIIKNADYFQKIIFFNSGAIYDMRFYEPKMKEEYFDTHIPVDEVGYAMYICSKIGVSMDNAIELRPFGVFGKYEDWQIRFISNMICKAVFDLPLTIKQNRRFDYLYIDDLVKIVKYFVLNSPHHRVYNVTPDKSIELMKLAELVRAISGKELQICIANPALRLEYSGDNSRLRRELPDFVFTDFDSAIRKLYSWYEMNKGKINRELLLQDK